MKVRVTAMLRGNGPISLSAPHETPKLPKESHDAYDLRTWREHAHCTESGEAFMPGFALKGCMTDAASLLGEKIPGKGSATYAKRFLGGVQVFDDLLLGVRKDDLLPIRIFAHADGKRGSGTRVYRRFPIIHSWKTTATIWVFDAIITQDVLERTLREAGNFCGLGRYRPAKGGNNGRFVVEKLKWEALD